jgi:hypothetical protein
MTRPYYLALAASFTLSLFVLAACASQDEMSALRSEFATSQEIARSAQSQATVVAAEASAAAASAAAAAAAAEQAAAAAQLAAEEAAQAAAAAKAAAIKNELLQLFHGDHAVLHDIRWSENRRCGLCGGQAADLHP